MSDNDYPEGTTAVCKHCRQKILLDQREGGGPGKDWGSTPGQWVGNGGIGMDYGCDANPESNKDGVAGHKPRRGTIREPERETTTDIIIKLHVPDTHPWANPASRPKVFNVQSEEDDEIVFATVDTERPHPTKGFVAYAGTIN